MKKNYQIFLCEDFYNKNTEIFKDKRVCEIASSKSSFSGQAYNIEFYTGIDGTHELSFNLPRYYFDEETGLTKTNELVELLVNKCKIELLLEGKSFFLVVNTRKDEEGDGIFSYSYSCADAYIEELSKNGYGLSFSDEVDGNGLGTIHQLAAEIVKDTDWTYKKENTGTLYEYTTDLKYNISQNRYDKVYTPVPVHPIKYIPELERYCYELEVFTKGKDERYRKVYCYDDTEQITSNTVKNLIYNADEFTDTTGWQSFKKGNSGEPVAESGLLVETQMVKEEGKSIEYNLKITKFGDGDTAITNSYLMNETAAEANQFLSAETPYIFKFDATEGSKGKIKGIRIYNKNPLVYSNLEPDYKITKDFVSNTYYSLKFKTSFSTPYVVFDVDCGAGDLIVKNFAFFQVKGKATKTGETIDVTAEQNNLILLGNLTNGIIVEQQYLDIMQMPDDIISSYTHKYTLYFTRDNYEFDEQGAETKINSDIDDTLTYLDFSEEVNVNENFLLQNGAFSSFSKKPIIEVDELVDEIKELGKNQIYLLSSDKRYYQYYEIERNGVIGGKWDYALFGDGANDKRRTLSASKSNRFNLIQELAELFKVWPVFNVYRDNDGNLKKEFWFKETCIKQNFSGFHKGVNLSSLSRNMVSDDIVTKMYVEDQESDYADNGFVTIRTSSLNPWGENYYYNFQYYVNQKLLNTMFDEKTLLIDVELDELYTKVKGINSQIFELNDKTSEAKVELSNLNARLTSLSVSIAAMKERVTSLEADIENYPYEITDDDIPPDVQNMTSNLESYSIIKEKYEKEQKETQDAYDSLKGEYDADITTIQSLQKEKEEYIFAFEKKYAQYIKEGVWSDSSYVDNDTYYIDSQKVMNTSSMPKTDWTISVIDGSVFEELSDFKVEVGDQTILVDNEFFGIQSNPEENYVFEVLISGIKDCLDEPTENIIEVRNYLTSFEDIFQRIAAATQTLELNEQTYDKSAYFTADGQIDQDILQKTLTQNALILANSIDGTYVFDNKTGISCQSNVNSLKKMRIIADGIFIANSNGLDGEPEWKTGITADGINASMLTTGEINTSLIKIFSKGQPTFSWNVLGISAYQINEQSLKVNSNSFIRFDQYGLYSINDKTGFNYDGNNNPWFEGLSSRKDALDKIIKDSTFSLTDRGFNLNVSDKGSLKLGYDTDSSIGVYGLYIKDSEGNLVVKLQNNGDNQVAGWNIQPGYLYSENNGKITGMQSSGDVAFIAGGNSKNDWLSAPFYVTHEGKLYAENAEIQGKISVGDGGTIAGFIISGNMLQCLNGNKTVGLSSSGSGAFWAGAEKPADAPFRVTHAGKLYASGAVIEGTINATRGNFSGNVTINGESVAKYSDVVKLLDKGNSQSYYINGGKIGGWDISSTSLSNNDKTVVLSTDGISFKKSDYIDAAILTYTTKVSFGTTKIKVPIGFSPLVDAWGQFTGGIQFKEADVSCISFYREYGLVPSQTRITGNLYFTGGALLFEIGGTIYSINMTKVEET